MVDRKRFAAALTVLAASLLAGIAQAEPGWDYPAPCCPKVCAPLATSLRLSSDAVQAGLTDVRLLDERVPVSADAYIGVSPDHRFHLCVVYDAFGNREITCLFVPAMV